jgi:hypothetical protein
VRIVRRYKNPVPPVFDIIARAKKLDQRIVDTDLQADNSFTDTRAVVRVASAQEVDRVVDEVNR